MNMQPKTIVMYKIILYTYVLGFTHLSFAQSTAASKLSRLTKADFGFQGIGFTYEPRLSDKVTIYLSAGAGGGYNIGEAYLNYTLELLNPAFYFSLTPKYFIIEIKEVMRVKIHC